MKIGNFVKQVPMLNVHIRLISNSGFQWKQCHQKQWKQCHQKLIKGKYAFEFVTAYIITKFFISKTNLLALTLLKKQFISFFQTL